MTDRIHLSKADVTSVEEEYVLSALRSGWIAPVGPDVAAFERELAEYVGVEHALALSSGTAALRLALLHIGARKDTVVLLPTMTFAATANTVAYTGAAPVFVDSQASDGNVDATLTLKAADSLLAEGHVVAAACPVDLFGRVCDYDILEPALAERGIPIIVDAAESLGSRYGNRAAGSFGQASAISFNGNKILTTSGGGMLLSDDADLIEHCRKLSTQAREPAPWYEHAEVGYNYRLSNILAALGRGQLTRLPDLVQKRRAIHQFYVDSLSAIETVRFLSPRQETGPRVDNCWLTTIFVDRADWDPLAATTHLSRKGIEARHLWKPMHTQPVYRQHRAFVNGVSERLFNQGLALPSSPSITQPELDRVVGALYEVLP